MYQIAYTKTALKDIPKLKAAHLDKKAKALIEVIRQNPYQTPPTYEKLVGNMYGLYSRRINYHHTAGRALRGQPLSQLTLTAPLSGEPWALQVISRVTRNLCLP